MPGHPLDNEYSYPAPRDPDWQANAAWAEERAADDAAAEAAQAAADDEWERQQEIEARLQDAFRQERGRVNGERRAA